MLSACLLAMVMLVFSDVFCVVVFSIIVCVIVSDIFYFSIEVFGWDIYRCGGLFALFVFLLLRYCFDLLKFGKLFGN